MKTRNVTGALFWGAMLIGYVNNQEVGATEGADLGVWLGVNIVRPAVILLFAWLTADQIQEIHQSLRSRKVKP